MARTTRSRRSYGAGEWGRNRVRVFPDPKTGLFQVEWRENGRRLTRSLGHRDWVRAKRQIHREPYHGRRSRKFNQDCMIRHSCLSTRSDPDGSGWRVKLNRLAGTEAPRSRRFHVSYIHWTAPRLSYAATGFHGCLAGVAFGRGRIDDVGSEEGSSGL